MSMFNDISWGSKNNKKECESNAQLVSLFATWFGAGQWSFLGPGSEKKGYSINEDSPQGEWDNLVERMMFEFAESGHPIFRATSPLSRGQLKSEGGGKLSIHYCADQETITSVFRTITSVNQLGLYGAVAEMCEEYENPITRKDPLWGEQSSSSFVPTVINTNVILRTKNYYCKDLENELESYHNKTNWANFGRMQDSWMLLKSDSISWLKTLEIWHNFMQWLVVNTLFQGQMVHHNQEDGSRKTRKLDPCWKLRPVAYKVNTGLKSELSLWTKTIPTHVSEFLMAWTSWSQTWTTTSRKPQKCSSKKMR